MSDLIKTAEDYRCYAQKKSNAHYLMCERAKGLNNKLGIPVTIASTVVGTTIFATLNSPAQTFPIQIAAGVVSLCAAVLSGLHTFFNYAQVAIQHKEAAADYESVRHELDIFILGSSKVTDDPQLQPALERLGAVAKHLDEITKRAPSIPDSIYDKVQTRVSERPILTPPTTVA